MKDWIDKEAFLSAATCLTQSWYGLRAPKRDLRPALEWRFHVGNEIGRAARDRLGNGIELPRSPVEIGLKATTEVLSAASANCVAFEATFAAADVVSRADAIRRNGGSWDLIEVKSGKLPADAGAVKAAYIDDLAFTALVAESSGLQIARCILMLVRGQYRLGSPLSELLGELDVTEQVLPRAREFGGVVPQITAGLRAQARPEPRLIFACKDCAFYETDCLGVGIGDPLFALPRLSAKRFEELKGYGRISALPPEAELTETQRRVADVIRSGKPLIEPDGLKHLDRVVRPVYYLDFESVNPAIPWFPDVAPYEQVPFQFSVHVVGAAGQEAMHYEYLAPNDGDWRQELAAQLVDRLGDRGSILTYSGYERRMINYLADALPNRAPRFSALQARLFDLEPVFKNGYCHPGFRGRTSIKATLPTMVQQEQLDYSRLAVRKGDDAAGLFALMRVGRYSPGECEVHRQNLLEYCKLDTLAMVRLHQELAKIRASLP